MKKNGKMKKWKNGKMIIFFLKKNDVGDSA